MDNEYKFQGFLTYIRQVDIALFEKVKPISEDGEGNLTSKSISEPPHTKEDWDKMLEYWNNYHPNY